MFNVSISGNLGDEGRTTYTLPRTITSFGQFPCLHSALASGVRRRAEYAKTHASKHRS